MLFFFIDTKLGDRALANEFVTFVSPCVNEVAKGLDKEYHVYRCRLGHRHHRAGPAEGALCYEKGRFPRQLRREEGERARKAVSQRLEGRHAAPLFLPIRHNVGLPGQPTRAHTNTRPKAARKAALAGWLALAISWSGLLVGWLLPSWRRRNWCQRDGAIVVLYAQDYKVNLDF